MCEGVINIFTKNTNTTEVSLGSYPRALPDSDVCQGHRKGLRIDLEVNVVERLVTDAPVEWKPRIPIDAAISG